MAEPAGISWETPAEEFAYECMFGAHPHALAELGWPKFVSMVRAKAGYDVPEETIRQALAMAPKE